MTPARRHSVVTACALACVIAGIGAAALYAQRGGGRNRRPSLDVQVQGNTPYDGRFIFVRLRYNSSLGGGFGRRGGGPGWAHDYPDGEVHFTKILDEVTFLRPRTDGSNILALDDAEIFNYPVLYMAEPGGWAVNEAEAAGFRNHLLKGGFAIFDDFRGYDFENLQNQIRLVLPDARWVEIDGTHPIFHSFFEIDRPLDLIPPYGGDGPPSYWGVFENNDPKQRLLMIANVNNDLSEYWEFSDQGVYIVDLSNEAYKFGVNYVIYAMTH